MYGKRCVWIAVVLLPLAGRAVFAAETAGKVDLFLAEKEHGLSARSVNHLRGYLSRAFTMARRMERKQFMRYSPWSHSAMVVFVGASRLRVPGHGDEAPAI